MSQPFVAKRVRKIHDVNEAVDFRWDLTNEFKWLKHSVYVPGLTYAQFSVQKIARKIVGLKRARRDSRFKKSHCSSKGSLVCAQIFFFSTKISV